MQTSTVLIDTFINQIKETDILSSSCEAIRAYEGGTLPVPIKKTYLSFACQENTVSFTKDESGNKIETDTVVIRMNSFIPLHLSLALNYSVTESVLFFLATKNENVTGFTVDSAEYDSDVDAYRISSRIFFTKVIS